LANATNGEIIHGLTSNGRALQAGVFNENEVRAAAGMMMAIGAMAFVQAFFAQRYLPLQLVATFFFLEFLIRVSLGLHYSPLGIAARWLTRRQEPLWVSAKPKRFAWTMGLVLAFAMVVISSLGIRGPLPLTLCTICMVLTWLESVLSLCIGCEIHGFLVRRGWASKDEDYEICTNGACELRLPARGEQGRGTAAT
jgi:hypothetical protein